MVSDKILVQLNNAAFKYPAGDYLFTKVKLTLKEGEKVAIVGANGSGKSTLLKIFTCNLKLEEGEQIINCKTHYVPQINLSALQKAQPIYEYISQFYDDWWEIPAKLEEVFNLIIDLELPVQTLSGGELMKLNLAIAVRHNPKVLVLDEPTNHLDVASIAKLISFINDGEGKNYAYIIVSHDIFFLDQVVDAVWELENQQITSYGGNYSFYREQKELHLRGLKRQYDLAKDKLEKTALLEQKNIENQAKRANRAKRAFLKGGVARITAHGAGRDSTGDLQHAQSTTIDRLTVEAEEKLEEFQTEDRHLAFINMKNTEANQGRTIFEVKEGILTIDKQVLAKNINLKVIYGDRVVIAGNNGVGKSSLIQALLAHADPTRHNELAKLSGEIYTGENLAWVYTDQNYSLIKPELTLLQNLLDYNKEITESKAKEQLGKFQFKLESEMAKPGGNLSGGEMVRLIMAMITSFPIDLLIMDEPTNNLDVETVEVLIKSLTNFRGAVMVISHNIDFLHRAGINTAYIIKAKKFTKMLVDPSHKDAFYQALV